MTQFATQPLRPFSILLDTANLSLVPEGPVLTRRMSDLDGLFADHETWSATVAANDPVVYTVRSSPVPETQGELPQSITTILPGNVSGEFFMTKGHQHHEFEGEIYLGLEGVGGLLMYNGADVVFLDMKPGVIGYIPPGWAHRSINTGSESYSFLAVYPGGAGHNYDWVLENGFGKRVFAGSTAPELRTY